MIDASDLRRTFGDRVAVDDVSLRVEAGETFGLLGPNGAGKSTTINMLVGLLPPDRGRIAVAEAGAPTDPAVRRHLGLAPQAIALYGELTAEENLAFFARLQGLHGRARRAAVDRALDDAGLADRRRDRVGKFSGGMKRRLNLAAAILHEPRVLFLDEPTAGVDPQSRLHLFERIEALAEAGMTILYTTHYMEEAMRLCDRVAIMDHGRLLALDTVPGLIDAHGGTTVIRAELAEPPADGRLPEGVPGSFDEGIRLRAESDRPMDDLAAIARSGLALRSLVLDRPDLETVFLNLTGRRLRD